VELAAAGTGVGTIGDSSFATIDAGGLIASGNVNAFAASDLAAVPVNVTTTLDNSSFASAGTLSVTTSSNGSYVSVSPASAEIPQATSVTQDIPVDTIQTGVAEGDVGALTGGNLSGVEGIFEGTNQGVPGVASGILGGGAGGGVAGGVEGGGGGFGKRRKFGGGGSFADFGGSGGFGGYPVALDLTGKGIKITPLSSSNMFFDMANSGCQQHTAWAGAGNGVLVYDPSKPILIAATLLNADLWAQSAQLEIVPNPKCNASCLFNFSTLTWARRPHEFR
jgi:hypothetical protein